MSEVSGASRQLGKKKNERSRNTSGLASLDKSKETVAMTRKRIAVVILGIILFACLLACGYFGAKTVRRSYQRRAAMAAYEKKDYMEAERLLLRYLRKDPNSEPEIVALANIYREFGDLGAEAQMWQMANSLNPLNAEYRKNFLDAAAKSASYSLLYSALGRKINLNEKLDETELYLYVISACRSGHAKEGKDVYKKQTEADREAFHKNDLGRLAEFLTAADTMSAGEQQTYLNLAVTSEDPIVRFEALYSTLLQELSQPEEKKIEEILKQLKEFNYYVGTPILANYLFSRYRFEDVFSEAEPYLERIDHINLYLLYAEACVLMDESDKLKALEKKTREKAGAMSTIADYCKILLAYLENDETKLVEETRKSAKAISSPIARFIRLRAAMSQGSHSEILAAANDLFSGPPFYDLFDRAAILCETYLAEQMLKPENQIDTSKMAELAKILSGFVKDDMLISNIILADQVQKGLAKEADLLAALDKFSNDPLLLRITVEYLVTKNHPEQALPLIEQILNSAGEKESQPPPRILFLKMMALDLTGQHDEAAEIFRKMVDMSEFEVDFLAEYFRFCNEYERINDLNAMADRLKTVKNGKLEQYGVFFRAAAVILTGDEAKQDEALKMLATATNDEPLFAFYAANELSKADRLDEAEKKYKAIQNTYPIPFLLYVNLSELYKAKGETEKAIEAAKKGYELGKTSWLSSFVYARRLSEAGRYEEAVEILNLPRRAGNYRSEVIDIWSTCMRKIIEKSIADQRYMQAEDQCRHLLTIVPGDEFGTENLAKVREKLRQKKDNARTEADGAAPAA